MQNEQTELLVGKLNSKAIQYLESNNFNGSLSHLHQAHYLLKNKKLTESIVRLRCTTLNNLGCVYKRLEKHKKALTYLNEALTLGTKYSSNIDTAGIHLNICAIKSLLSAHEEALSHALKGLKIAQKHFTPSTISIQTLLSGYLQSGLEYQFLHKNKEAAKYLAHGYDVACTYLGKNHMTTYKFFKALHDKSLKEYYPVNAQNKPVLKPIETKNYIHQTHRPEVRSTEPLKIYKIRKPNHSYSSSPLNNSKAKLDNASSKTSVLSYGSLGPKINYIENTFKSIQQNLDNYLKKAIERMEEVKNIATSVPSSFSTPTQAYTKRNQAAIAIQKNIRMWKCRKKYKRTVNSIIKIQKAYRDYKYLKYLNAQKEKIKNFSQQFNKNILDSHHQKRLSGLKTQDTQTEYQIYLKIFHQTYYPASKKYKIYDTVLIIQKFIRKFLSVRKSWRRQQSIFVVKSFIVMGFLLKKHWKKLCDTRDSTDEVVSQAIQEPLGFNKDQTLLKAVSEIQYLARTPQRTQHKAEDFENLVVVSKKTWD
jgi:tetratricopeptide (TPR) repeat protein